jgi:hypothetical protein
MVESIAASVIDKALEAVLRKVGEGKKLSTEDLVVLMLGLFREIRKEVADLRNDVNKRIDETNRRIDALYELMGKIYETLIKQEVARKQ